MDSSQSNIISFIVTIVLLMAVAGRLYYAIKRSRDAKSVDRISNINRADIWKYVVIVFMIYGFLIFGAVTGKLKFNAYDKVAFVGTTFIAAISVLIRLRSKK